MLSPLSIKSNRNGFISLYVLAAVAVVALICLAIIARNWSCRKQREPRPPRIVTIGPFNVVDVPTGASIVVSTGRRDRRETTIQLQYVQAPASGEWAQISADHLREMAGDKITVQYEKHGLFRGDEAQDSQRRLEDEGVDTADNDAGNPFEARGPIIGIVYGASRINLNLAQVEGGYADCTADAPKEYQAAKKKAQKAETGMWSQ